jgi:hypothetical protein
VSPRAPGIVSVVVNVVLGLIFVRSGAAGWLWEHVERDVPWRTGPTTIGTVSFLAICWFGWFIVNAILLSATPRRSAARDSVRSAAAGSFAARQFIASGVLVAVQVLVPSMWLPVTLALLLLASLLNAYIIREPFARTITAFAWRGAGIALATLLIHPWFIGQPHFIVRLAIVMTAWDWIGERLGVTPRVLRFVPSFYSGSSG